MIDKEQFKTWLKAKPNGRQWLAEQLKVSLTSVKCWASTRPIPARAENQIRALMMADSLPDSHLTVPFTADEYALIEHATKLGKYTDTTDFARDAIKARARMIEAGMHGVNEKGEGFKTQARCAIAPAVKTDYFVITRKG